jgi:hypothetical protein
MDMKMPFSDEFVFVMASTVEGVAIQRNSHWITTFATQTRDDGRLCAMGTVIFDEYILVYIGIFLNISSAHPK